MAFIVRRPGDLWFTTSTTFVAQLSNTKRVGLMTGGPRYVMWCFFFLFKVPGANNLGAFPPLLITSASPPSTATRPNNDMEFSFTDQERAKIIASYGAGWLSLPDARKNPERSAFFNVKYAEFAAEHLHEFQHDRNCNDSTLRKVSVKSHPRLDKCLTII